MPTLGLLDRPPHGTLQSVRRMSGETITEPLRHRTFLASRAKRGGRCTAELLDGETVRGRLSVVNRHAFTVRLPDGAIRAIKFRDCDHVRSELSA